jgi:hypothetical protein
VSTGADLVHQPAEEDGDVLDVAVGEDGVVLVGRRVSRWCGRGGGRPTRRM